jgi:hypothetical protein
MKEIEKIKRIPIGEKKAKYSFFLSLARTIKGNREKKEEGSFRRHKGEKKKKR